MAEIKDTDLLLVNRSDKTYTISGSDFKESFEPEIIPEVATPSIIAPPDGAGVGGDVNYTPKTSAATNVIIEDGGWNDVTTTYSQWYGMTYGDGKFVAVAYNGTDRATYSTDGINWTAVGTANGVQAIGWHDVTYGGGKFVAVAVNGVDTVMYSSDGINWTAGGNANGVIANSWAGVTYGDGKFVAVAYNGNNRVMYSTDGINWTPTISGDETTAWYAVTYADGKFVAVGRNGTNNVMYSTNGVSWTAVGAANGVDNNQWQDVTYGDGKFVAVSQNGTTNRVMYSTDGINWTGVGTANGVQTNQWQSVIYGDDKFVAVADTGPDYVMYSTDGINWKGTTNGVLDAGYKPLAYGNGKYVAGAYGFVMWSTSGGPDKTELTLTDDKTYNAADGADMERPISETFSAGQTVKAESTVVYADTPCFSTTLYNGNQSTQKITTDINLKDSLIWIKSRDNSTSHYLMDTVRGNESYINSNLTSEERSGLNYITSFLTDGFTLGNSVNVNQSGKSYVSWSFRAAPGFFDVVKYTGTGANTQTIPHRLGSTPGVLIVKRLDDVENWCVYHKDIRNAEGNILKLNDNDAATTTNTIPSWAGTEPDDNNFYVGNYLMTGLSGSEYIAYLFADTPGLIKCGNYNGNGTTSNPVNCGFRPAWVMLKNVSDAQDWKIIDAVRGDESAVGAKDCATLYPNKDRTEFDDFALTFTNSGFEVTSNGGDINSNNQNYIFVAIAENAMAPPPPATGTIESVVNNVLTLTDVGETWSAGDFAINDTEVTKTGPGADVLEFVGSVPVDIPEDIISDWGNATWQVADNSSFTGLMEGTKLITDDTSVQTFGPDDRGSIVLAADTQYWVRLKYAATTPSVESSYSAAVTFKTASDTLEIDDLFSTTLYTGDDVSFRIVPTGIDNTTKSLIWFKRRSGIDNHFLFDTVRGVEKSLSSDNNFTEQPRPGSLISFGSDGFTCGTDKNVINNRDSDMVAWNFRAAPGFFDIQVYLGSQTPRAIQHNLDSVPAMMIIKDMTRTESWMVYHKDTGSNAWLELQDNGGKRNDISGDMFGGQVPTSTEFYLGNSPNTNNLNEQFVAYLFADTPGLIKCGFYTGNGISSGNYTDCGFEPGWVMVKCSTDNGEWVIWDNKRVDIGKTIDMYADLDVAESKNDSAEFTPTGFNIIRSIDNINAAGKSYIFIAIAAGADTTFFDPESFKALNGHQVERRFGVDPTTVNVSRLPINRLTHEPRGVTETFVQEGDLYRPLESTKGGVNSISNDVNTAQNRLNDIETNILARISAVETATGNEP